MEVDLKKANTESIKCFQKYYIERKGSVSKKEYGEGGSSPAVGFINVNYDAKGMSLSRYREIGKRWNQNQFKMG